MCVCEILCVAGCLNQRQNLLLLILVFTHSHFSFLQCLSFYNTLMLTPILTCLFLKQEVLIHSLSHLLPHVHVYIVLLFICDFYCFLLYLHELLLFWCLFIPPSVCSIVYVNSLKSNKHNSGHVW